jgi:hypothetical protein
MYSQVSAITRYVSFGKANHHFRAPLWILGHKMTNETKAASFKTQGALDLEYRYFSLDN